MKLLLIGLSYYPVGGQTTAGALARRLALEIDVNEKITCKAISLIADHLKSSSPVISELILNLDVRNVDDNENSLLHLVEALQTNNNLVKLKLFSTKLFVEQSTLSEMLQEKNTLTHLGLISYNSVLTSSVAGSILLSLQHNTTLVDLNLSHTGITATEDTTRALGKLLCVNKTLTHLDLSNNEKLADLGFYCIFLSLQHNTTLVYLNLSLTGLTATEDTTQALGEMLRVNKTLAHLNLSHNENLAECVFVSLQHNTTLVNLNLSNAGITTTQALGKLLRVNKTVTHLNLSNNEKLGAGPIFLSLQHNTTFKLVDLNLSRTGITAMEDTTRALGEMLRVNKTLTHLDLSNNEKLADLGARCIFLNLQHNTTLVDLNLSCTGITYQGAEYIAQAFKCNHCLEILDISGNILEVDGCHCIIKSLESSTSLRTISLYNTMCEVDSATQYSKAVNQARQKKGLISIEFQIRKYYICGGAKSIMMADLEKSIGGFTTTKAMAIK